MRRNSKRYRKAMLRQKRSAWDALTFNMRLITVIRASRRMACDMTKLGGLLGELAKHRMIAKECALLEKGGAQ